MEKKNIQKTFLNYILHPWNAVSWNCNSIMSQNKCNFKTLWRCQRGTLSYWSSGSCSCCCCCCSCCWTTCFRAAASALLCLPWFRSFAFLSHVLIWFLISCPPTGWFVCTAAGSKGYLFSCWWKICTLHMIYNNSWIKELSQIFSIYISLISDVFNNFWWYIIDTK